MSNPTQHSTLLDKKYENLRGAALLAAPVYALSGITPADATLLAKSLGIHTIGDLATNRLVKAAQDLALGAATPEVIGAPSDTQAIVNNLNAGWYNVVTAALGITDPNFQLAQGPLGLQTTDSSGLFLMADSQPASAAVHYYDPSGLSKRSSAYNLLLTALLPEISTSLRSVLGDMYTKWLTFQTAFWTATPAPASTTTQLAVFKQFANQQLDPTVASQGIAAIEQAALAPLGLAMTAWGATSAVQTFTDSAGDPVPLFIYSGTLDAATQAINNGAGPISFDYDSTTANTTLSHVTADGSNSGFFDIFFGGGSSTSLDQLNTKATASGFTITGTIGKVGTLVTNPGSWFTSSEFTRAFNAPNDNTIWNAASNAGSWDSFFGPQGSLARRVSSFILVSDYTIVVTSKATYSQQDLQTIQTSSSGGMWPFFSGSQSSTQTTTYALDSNSCLVATHKLNKGLIQIWGVTTVAAPG